MMRFAVLLAFTFALALPAQAQDLATRAALAARDLREVCNRDDGRMWGVSLCGPLIIVDPATREAWATQADANGVLQPSRNGFMGVLPPDAPIANTAVEWAGTRWIMLVYVPENEVERRVLVAHEAWHRVQAQLGFSMRDASAAHLESERGRYLLRLEMRALSAALRSRGGGQRRALRDALAFRAARLAAFPDARALETALDRNEGLASYTGTKLGAGRDADAYAARILDQHDSHEAFARAYAYATGPAYGLLLDSKWRNWRRFIADNAPADMLAQRTRFEPIYDALLVEAAARYNGAQVAAEERARAEAQAVRIAEFRARFETGPRLVLPLANARREFNPNQITPVEGLGSVYETLTLRDGWGELRVSQGALLSGDFSRAVVGNPGPDGLSGPGWSLSLTSDYHISAPDPTGARHVVPGPAPLPEPASAPRPRR